MLKATKLIFPVILSVFLIGFTSCALLPVEEPVLPPPVLRSYDVDVYKYAVSTRGDMQSYKDVSVNYVPAKQEALSFSIGDVLIEGIKVQVGDTVTKGQILAELNRDSILADLRVVEHEMEVLGVRLRQLEEMHSLDIQMWSAEKNTYDTNYQQDRNNLLSEIEIKKIRLQELNNLNDQRILRAGIDGTVTYVRTHNEGDYSEEGARVISLADKTLSVFTMNGKDAELFSPGKQVQIKVSNEFYDAIVVSADEIGAANEANKVYFKLTSTLVELKESSYGSIRVILDERTNVIMVPTRAVKTANEESIVYTMEDGIRTARQVKIGLVANDMIEITEGLEEGVSVIAE